METLLPTVLDNLQDTGRTETFHKFFQLVSENRFPLKNIAWLLFLDVVDFLSCTNTSGMCYKDPRTVRVWKIGYKLMHGKLLRFFGGSKHQGQVVSGRSEKGLYSSEDAEINFAVPDLKTLQKFESSIDLKAVKPGIIVEMVEKFKTETDEFRKTYKICVDGKKINGCSDVPEGQINLFGFEGSPTVNERMARLEKEKELLNSFVLYLNELDVKRKEDFTCLNSDDHGILISFVKDIILLLSCRLKDVREARLKRERALAKFKILGGSDWRKSKYGYIISHIQVWLYRASSSIKSILRLTDKLCRAGAAANSSLDLFHTSQVDLGKQENYICLQEDGPNPTTDNSELQTINPQSIKQGSELWHSLRASAKVTGSTAYKALGLESLKKQQEHYKVFCKIDGPEFSARTKQCKEHGVKNEINCVATLISKILPVFYPELSYKEEGCNVEPLSSSAFLVSSPDGSCGKEATGDPIFACEFKCPMPGNIHTTPVHYNIPVYYAIQLLAEINTLKTDKLIYVSYSEESSTVFLVNDDPDLWTEILDELKAVYGPEKPKRPSKKSPAIEVLRGKLKSFVVNKTDFMGEFPSVKAKKCSCDTVIKHVLTSGDAVGYNCVHTADDNYDKDIEKPTLQEMQTDANEMIQVVETVDKLTISQATEILVYILSDLDRNRTLQMPHAVPIGYGLKGYSLSVSVFRKMLLHTLGIVNKHVYCPISCFDGQWFPLTSRDSDDSPLTLIQLQKDCFKSVKSMSKAAIVSAIRNANRHASFGGNPEHVNIYEMGLCFETPPGFLKLLVGQTVVAKVAEKEEPSSPQESNSLVDILPQEALSDSEVISDILQVETDLLVTNDSEENLPVEPVIDEEQNEIQNENDGITPDINETNMAEHRTFNGAEKTVFTDTDIEKMLLSLQSDPKRQDVWLIKSVAELKKILNDENVAMKYLQKSDILVCLRAVREKLRLGGIEWKASWVKPKLLATLCGTEYSDNNNAKKQNKRGKTAVSSTCQSLQAICWGIIELKVKSATKEELNLIYSEIIYPVRLAKYRQSAPIKDYVKVYPFGEPPFWYCQPERLSDLDMYHFSFIDPTHILTNLRSKICTSGIKERNLSRESWIEIAKESNVNGTGLNRVVIEDIIDKQNVGFALKMISEEVQDAFERKGKIEEARFCYVLRRWYEAEDNRSISVAERCRRRLEMRSWLLEGVDLKRFSWYGRYVTGIPIVTFESLLVNIDRRLQLYSFTVAGSYNVRCIGSLENEEFFGEFHELDPKHVGLLHPKDIQTVMHTALELSSVRLDSNRGFVMKQSSKRVYPIREVDQMVTDLEMPVTKCISI